MPRTFLRLPLQLRGAAIALLALAGILFACVEGAWAAPAIPPVREDRILILPKAGRGAALDNLHANGRVKIRKKLSRLGNIQILELPPGANPQAAVERYRRSGHVETVDLDYRRWQPAATPDDPAFSSQWHLQNTGQFGNTPLGPMAGTPGADIEAPAAWDTLRDASNVIVAVVDTGVRYTHQDLAANMWINPGESGGGKETNGLDDDNNGYIDDVHGIDAVTIISTNNGNPNDTWFGHGHGTHVAGIIGAVGNNAAGVCGVAWRVQLMACKFINTSSGTDSDLAECLDYAVAHGADVINASIVGAGPASMTLSNAMWSVRQAGVIVCAAAGNVGSDNDVVPYYPGGFRMDNLITVTATSRRDLWVNNYNYGAASVHLAAPGYDIYSTGRSSDTDYFLNYGTSMAAPCVSGAAALVRARFPDESCQQIVARVLGSVDPLPSLAGRCCTGGRLNLRRALDPATMPVYSVTNAAFDWIPTNAMTPLTFATSDGVCGPFALPFEFPVCGRSYSQVFVSANGLIGFTNTGLSLGVNTDLPSTNTPNDMICAYWDDLNPLSGGRVWFGTAGVAPNRKAVASWVSVPHASMAGGGAMFTFQAILHESGQISFQYLQVETGSATLKQGKSATIGIEDSTGLFGTRHIFNGTPSLLTNNQALVLVPPAPVRRAPGLHIAAGPLPGQTQLQLSAAPALPASILCSTNLANWSLVASNILPASGLSVFTDTNAAPQKFFRAVSGPFGP